MAARVPNDWAGAEVHLRWAASAEECVFSADGRALQGMNGSDGADGFVLFCIVCIARFKSSLCEKIRISVFFPKIH